jgi:hypothetical protein
LTIRVKKSIIKKQQRFAAAALVKGWDYGRLLPAIQPTFPDARMLKSRVFPSTHLAVIETSFLTLKECACDQYHFLIPLRQAPLVRMENKLHTLKKMSVFPCNPM